MIIFKSHALKCWSVVACVRTVTVFVKVMIISMGKVLAEFMWFTFLLFEVFFLIRLEIQHLSNF